jgi:hypothetical protein
MKPAEAQFSRRLFLRRALLTGIQLGAGSIGLVSCGPSAPLSATPVASDLDLAPPITTVDGLRAVPIDIQHVDARIVFDLAARQAHAEATMKFIMGAENGTPIFDLRQEIQEVALDDRSIAPTQVRHHDFGGGAGAELRILEARLPARSEHTLRLRYPLDIPQSPLASPSIAWDSSGSRIYWDFWFSDLWPGRYLEMWLPANLIYDRFGVILEVEVTGSMIAHRLVTNGQVAMLGTNHWRVEFPEHFTALSPMLLLAAQDRLNVRESRVALPGMPEDLQLEVVGPVGGNTDLELVEQQIQQYLVKNVSQIGPYGHGNRFTAYIWENQERSMEYNGAVTSNVAALEHEVFHSWYARGLKPASQNDGWIDEAWDNYNTRRHALQERPFDMSEAPVTLCSANLFNRVTPQKAYSNGERFFAGLAASFGRENLQAAMSAFYRENQGQRVTTQQLEAFLIDRSGQAKLADYFKRFVYGRA